jgi:hypothetical protein
VITAILDSIKKSIPRLDGGNGWCGAAYRGAMSKIAVTTSPRTWDTGMVRPFRPVPRNFREVYLRNGWIGLEGSIEEIFGANYRCIARWIEECGGDELRAARSAITGTAPRPSKRSKRYVLGRTLTAHQTFSGGGRMT